MPKNEQNINLIPKIGCTKVFLVTIKTRWLFLKFPADSNGVICFLLGEKKFLGKKNYKPNCPEVNLIPKIGCTKVFLVTIKNRWLFLEFLAESNAVISFWFREGKKIMIKSKSAFIYGNNQIARKLTQNKFYLKMLKTKVFQITID